MLLLSPQSAWEYSTLLLLAFAIGGIYLFFTACSIASLSLFIFSYILLGHVIPFSVLVRYLPLGIIREWLGLQIYTRDEIYKAIGLPFLGFFLLLLFYVFIFCARNSTKTQKSKKSPSAE